MRTRKEVIARIEELIPSAHDPFGVMVGLLVFFLHYRDSRRFLKAHVTKEEWDRQRHPMSEERVGLLLGAGARASWVFANKRQGIESNKGFMILEALCWMLSPEHHAWAERTFWTRGIMSHYGKPQLVELHGRFGLSKLIGPWQDLDDGLWRNDDFGVDLDRESALRQWHAKWDRLIVGGFSNGNGQG